MIAAPLATNEALKLNLELWARLTAFAHITREGEDKDVAPHKEDLKRYLLALKAQQWALVDLDTTPTEDDRFDYNDESESDISILSNIILLSEKGHFDILKIVLQNMNQAQWQRLDLFYADKHTEMDLLWQIADRVCESESLCEKKCDEDAKDLFDLALGNLSLQQWVALSKENIKSFDEGYAYVYEGALRQTRWDKMRDFCCALAAAQASDHRDDVKSFSNLVLLACKAAKDHHPDAYLMLQDFLLNAGHHFKAEMVQTMINDYRDRQPERLTYKKERTESVKQKPAAIYTPARDLRAAREVGVKDRTAPEADTANNAKRRKGLRDPK